MVYKLGPCVTNRNTISFKLLLFPGFHGSQSGSRSLKMKRKSHNL